MSSTFLQIATIEHEQKGEKLYIDKEKDGTYIPMEVQDNSAAYEGFITPKSQKKNSRGRCPRAPAGAYRAPDPAGQGYSFCDFFKNSFSLKFAQQHSK